MTTFQLKLLRLKLMPYVWDATFGRLPKASRPGGRAKGVRAEAIGDHAFANAANGQRHLRFKGEGRMRKDGFGSVAKTTRGEARGAVERCRQNGFGDDDEDPAGR